MRQKLESKKKMMENMSIRSRMAKEEADKQEEQLSGAVQSLLVAGGAFSVASRNLQVSLCYTVVDILPPPPSPQMIKSKRFSSLYHFFFFFI